MDDAWDISRKVEENVYFNFGSPVIENRKSKNNPFVHIDLFSGCGGFSCGFEQSGFVTELAIDIHKPSIETIRKNHKNTSTICGDIRKIKPKDCKKLITTGKSNIVITAGVPCQGFSRSNRKQHDDDERNFYFREFLKFVEEFNPSAVIVENVSGIAKAKEGYFLKTISNEISKLGYKVHTNLINSAEYGVPQTRRRFFFVGVKKKYEWLFPPKTHSRENFNTVGDAILGDLPPLKNNQSKNSYKSAPKNPLQLGLRKDCKELTNHLSPNHPQATIEMIKNTKPGDPMYKKFKQRIRLNKNLPSPTQVCGGIRPQFQFGHPTQSRGLSIRERARIQTFPDSYEIIGGITQGRVQTGNAVPVLVAKALSKQLKKMFEGKRLKGFRGDLIQEDLF